MQLDRVDVGDELFARLKAHFSNEQLVEITALLTVVDLDRFDAASGIGSAGFSAGMRAARSRGREPALANVTAPSRS